MLRAQINASDRRMARTYASDPKAPFTTTTKLATSSARLAQALQTSLCVSASCACTLLRKNLQLAATHTVKGKKGKGANSC